MDYTFAWENITENIKPEWDWIQFKIDAVNENPVILGNLFEERIRDTWITSGPIESQRVACNFISPLGKIIKVPGSYNGEFEWHIRYRPNEIGRWRYFWEHKFTGDIKKSSIGIFDIIGGSRSNLLKQLNELIKDMQKSNLLTHYERMERFGGSLFKTSKGYNAGALP